MVEFALSTEDGVRFLVLGEAGFEAGEFSVAESCTAQVDLGAGHAVLVGHLDLFVVDPRAEDGGLLTGRHLLNKFNGAHGDGGISAKFVLDLSHISTQLYTCFLFRKQSQWLY